MIRVYLVDDHTLFIEGMKAALNKSDRVCITHAFTTLDACRKALALEQPDVLLMDISMPDGNGETFCKEVTQAYPKMNVIALTVHDEYSVVKRMLANGAKGYILKSISTAELVEAIVQVQQEKVYLSPEIAAQQRKHADVHLTPREKEVLLLLIEGYTSEQIAKKLYLSDLTVKWYRQNLLTKLEVKTSTQLIAKAIRERLV